jgi:hypothetical protein
MAIVLGIAKASVFVGGEQRALQAVKTRFPEAAGVAAR